MGHMFSVVLVLFITLMATVASAQITSGNLLSTPLETIEPSLEAAIEQLQQSAGIKVDMVMRNIKRVITQNADGKYAVSVEFTAGNDASDHTISSYAATYIDSNQMPQVVKAGHSRICNQNHECSFRVLIASSLQEAREKVITAGFLSIVNVLFMKDPGTVQITLRGGLQTCEAERSSDCTCFPCSTGDIGFALSSSVRAEVRLILDIQNLAHLHPGWVTLVP